MANKELSKSVLRSLNKIASLTERAESTLKVYSTGKGTKRTLGKASKLLKSAAEVCVALDVKENLAEVE